MWCEQHWAKSSKDSAELLARKGGHWTLVPLVPTWWLLLLMTTLSAYMRFWGVSWPMEALQPDGNCLECNIIWNMTLIRLQGVVVSTCGGASVACCSWRGRQRVAWVATSNAQWGTEKKQLFFKRINDLWYYFLVVHIWRCCSCSGQETTSDDLQVPRDDARNV